jgi:hypothetical protein
MFQLVSRALYSECIVHQPHDCAASPMYRTQTQSATFPCTTTPPDTTQLDVSASVSLDTPHE